MKTIYNLHDVVKMLSNLSIDDIKMVGEALVTFDPCHAERLKNAISFGQQEMDALENREREYEMLSRQSDEEWA